MPVFHARERSNSTWAGLHRLHGNKKEVQVYDYADIQVAYVGHPHALQEKDCQLCGRLSYTVADNPDGLT